MSRRSSEKKAKGKLPALIPKPSTSKGSSYRFNLPGLPHQRNVTTFINPTFPCQEDEVVETNPYNCLKCSLKSSTASLQCQHSNENSTMVPSKSFSPVSIPACQKLQTCSPRASPTRIGTHCQSPKRSYMPDPRVNVSLTGRRRVTNLHRKLSPIMSVPSCDLSPDKKTKKLLPVNADGRKGSAKPCSLYVPEKQKLMMKEATPEMPSCTEPPRTPSDLEIEALDFFPVDGYPNRVRVKDRQYRVPYLPSINPEPPTPEYIYETYGGRTPPPTEESDQFISCDTSPISSRCSSSNYEFTDSEEHYYNSSTSPHLFNLTTSVPCFYCGEHCDLDCLEAHQLACAKAKDEENEEGVTHKKKRELRPYPNPNSKHGDHFQTLALKETDSLANLPPHLTSQAALFTVCVNCGWEFGPEAALLHLPECAKLQRRIADRKIQARKDRIHALRKMRIEKYREAKRLRMEADDGK